MVPVQLPEEDIERPVEPKPPRDVLPEECDADDEDREDDEDDENQEPEREPNQERDAEAEEPAAATWTASIACALGRGRPSGKLAPK